MSAKLAGISNGKKMMLSPTFLISATKQAAISAYVGLLSVLILPSCLLGFIPLTFLDFIRHPYSYVEDFSSNYAGGQHSSTTSSTNPRIGGIKQPSTAGSFQVWSSWRWFTSSFWQSILTITCLACFFISCVYSFYLAVEYNTGAILSSRGERATDNYVFLFTLAAVCGGSFMCIFTWIFYSTRKFAEAWTTLMNQDDQFLQNCSTLIFCNSKNSQKWDILKFWMLAATSFLFSMSSFGLQIYASLMPYADIITTPGLKVLYFIGLVYSDAFGCWTFVSTFLLFKITARIAVAFSGKFEDMVVETLEKFNRNMEKRRSRSNTSTSFSSSSSLVVGPHESSEMNSRGSSADISAASMSDLQMFKPIMRTNNHSLISNNVPNRNLKTISTNNYNEANNGDLDESPEEALISDLERLRNVYTTFGDIYSKYWDVNRIQLLAVYASGCCIVLTSSYFAVAGTFGGRSGFKEIDLYVVSHWLSAVTGIASLIWMCEIGQTVSDTAPRATACLRVPLRGIPAEAWWQVQAMIEEITANPLKATLFNCMTLDRPLMVAAFTTILTYLIVLIDFKTRA